MEKPNCLLSEEFITVGIHKAKIFQFLKDKKNWELCLLSGW